jgi:energy-coupling factor transport system ATP-binding protein
MEPIIRTRDLHYAYADAACEAPDVLCGVSLDIAQGSFVAVLGHNGSGKSTLAKHFNAVLLPAGGKVFVNGMDTENEALHAGDPPHGGDGLSESGQPDRGERGGGGRGLRTGDLGVPTEEIRRRVDEALKMVGM